MLPREMSDPLQLPRHDQVNQVIDPEVSTEITIGDLKMLYVSH